MPNPEHFEALICVTGMGDPEAWDTLDWVRRLFPTVEVESQDEVYWVRPAEDRQVFLYEVGYEDANKVLIEKFEGVRNIFGLAPESAAKALEEYLGDVFGNVMTYAAMEFAQNRFIRTYGKVLDEAIRRGHKNVRKGRIGVLGHSLGTYIAYQGLYKVFDFWAHTQFMPVRLVMCAPMLAPIDRVQRVAQLRSYLTENAAMKPYRTNAATGKRVTYLQRCMARYNTLDPFYLLHSESYYDRDRINNDLVDTFLKFKRGVSTDEWNTHSMTTAYLGDAEHADSIERFLFEEV